MPDKYLYLLVDTLCIIFPFLFSFHPKIRFYRQWRYFLVPCLSTAAIFIVWDIIFTAKGVWSFNPRYVVGIYFYHLPLEELLFFFCIPYACVFTYYCLSSLLRLPAAGKNIFLFTWVFVAALLIMAALNLPRLYTSVTFILLAALLSFMAYKKLSFLAAFYISYLAILLPFYMSNGVLTGLITPEPVVMYNNNYNLGIRTLTIPIEDIFYGMAMLLMNIAGFEYMRTGFRKLSQA